MGNARSRSRSRHTIQYWNFTRWLNEQIEAQGKSRSSIARHFGFESPSRISHYLNCRIVAGPAVVRKFASALDISPIEALRQAGYYSAIFDEFAKLYERGWLWCQRDNVSFLDGEAHFFSQTADSTVDSSSIPKSLRASYHQGLVYGTYLGPREIQRKVAVPLPIADGILLAVGLFPRRGDGLKTGAHDFITQLTRSTGPILNEEWYNSNRNRPTAVFRALTEAAALFKDRRRPGEVRAALSSEYVQRWAEEVSRPYTLYARLALYDFGGRIQYSEDGIVKALTDNPWEYQSADIPRIEDFTLVRP